MDRIKVGVKIRPLIQREKAANADVHWQAVGENSVSQIDPSTGRLKGEQYTFDHVFGPESSNREVFEVLVKPIVESAVRGFNGTIFAYGQTASGKTYTMMGDQFEQGIIPQAVNLIFNTIENSHGREFLLRVCYMEIYNEKVHDLLCKSNRNLKVSEDSSGNVIVKELEEAITSSSQMVMDLMKRGETIRKIGVTNMNERSSRSHSIFRVIIESRAADSETDEAIQVSHLNLVDLAGSERAGATGSVGDQFKEGCAINKSLFTLGKVISQLSEGQSSFVNFRDSKLTRILQSSLGGNALTAIVCAITPAALEETSSTLGFASRARNIQNTAQVNEVLTERALLKRYIKQIHLLKSEISSLEEKNAETKHLQDQNTILQERLSRLKDALLVSNPEDSDQSQKNKKLKQLRRRTWSAPNRNVSRLSLAAPFNRKITESVSSLQDIKEEDSRLSILSTKSDLDESMFATPLEEFEKALIKAERDKSLDWMPSVDTLEEETFRKSMDTEVDDTLTPALNYVQTRRNRGFLRLEEDFIPETPPAKLRAKIRDVEKELEEMHEFTKLEKQMFDESLLEDNKALREEVRRLRDENDSLQDVKKHLQDLELNDKNSHDLQILLMDTTKEVSKLTDEKKELVKKLSDAEAQCINIQKIIKELDSTKKELSNYRKETLVLKSSLGKQDEQIRLLQNEKEDFDFQFEIMRGNYEKRLKDITQALEDARHETNTSEHVMRHNGNGGLYSLAEEPTIDEVVQQLEMLKEENKDLLQQLNNQNLLLSEKSSKLEEMIVTNSELVESMNHMKENDSIEIRSLRDRISVLEVNATGTDSELRESATNNDVGGSLSSQLTHGDTNCQNCMELDEKLCTIKSLLCCNIEDINCDESSTLESLIQLMTASFKDMKEKYRSLEQCYDSSETNVKNKEAEIEGLQERCNKSEKEIQFIRGLLSEAECINDDENMSVASMVEKLLPLIEKSASNNSVPEEISESLRSSSCLVDAATQCLEDSMDTIAHVETEQLQEEIINLRNAYDTMAKELEAKEQSISKSAVEIQQLKQQIDLLEDASTADAGATQHQEASTVDSSAYIETERLQEELKSLKNKHDMMAVELEAKEHSISKLTVEIEQLREQICLLGSMSTSEAQSIDSLENGVNENNSTSNELLVDALQKRCIESEEELHSIRCLLSVTECLNEDENMSVVSMVEKLLSLLQESSSNASGPKEISESVLSSSCPLVDAATQCLEDSKMDTIAHVETEQLQEEIINLRNAYDTMAKELEAKEQSISKSAVEIQQLKQQIDLLEGASIPDAGATQHPKASTVDSSANIETEHLLEELKFLRNKHDTMADELEAKAHSISKSTLVIEQLREQICLFENMSTCKAQLNESLKVEFNKERCNKLEEELNEKYEEEIRSLQNAYDTMAKELEAKDQSISKSAVEIEQLKQQIALLEDASTPDPGATHHLEASTVDSSANFETERLREELVSLRNKQDMMAVELEAKEQSIIKSSTDIDQLRNQICLLESASVCKLHELNGDQDVDSTVQNEIKNLETINENLLSDLDKKDRLVNEAAVEMEHLREQILKLECGNSASTPASLLDNVTGAEPSDDELLDVTTNLHSISSHSIDQNGELEVLQARCHVAEEELNEIRGLLSQRDGALLKGVPLADLISNLLESSAMNVVNVSPLSEVSTSEAVIEHQKKIDELVSTKDSLLSELDCKNALLADTEVELRQLKERVLELQSKPFIEQNPSEEVIQHNSEVSILKFEKEALEVELKSKTALVEEVQQDLIQVRRIAQDLQKELQDLAEEPCQKCKDLENEMDSAQKTLLSELKAISNNGSVEELPLPSLVSEFLASVMKAQQHVASIFQSKIDDCTKELEATLLKENENQKIIEELKSELKHYNDRNESLREAFEDLKQEEHDALGLLGVVNKLKMLLGAMETVTYDELVSILENKLMTLRSLCDESEHLRADVEQQLSQNKILTSSIIDLENQMSEQKNMIMILEQSASEANKILKINEENIRELNKENAKERSVAEELRMEIVHKDELLGKLQKQLSELQNANERSLAEDLRVEIVHRDEVVGKLKEQLSELQDKLDQMSAETELVNTLKADLHSKEEDLLQLEAKLQQVLLEMTTHKERAHILSEENAELRLSISTIEQQVSEQKEMIMGLEQSVSECKQTLKVTEENSEKLNEELSLEKAVSDGLRQEIESKAQHSEELALKLNNLQQELMESRTKEALVMELQNQLSEERSYMDDLRKQVTRKDGLIEEQEKNLTELRMELQAQVKLVAGKDLLHSKATSLYNELSEKKELINKLTSDLSTKTSALEEKENMIDSLQKCVDDLEKRVNALQSDLSKSKAEKEIALKNLALKSTVTPTEAVQEIKAENEFLKQQHDEVLKASRDMRSRNRKLQVELNRLKEKSEEDKKVNSLAISEVATLRGQLHEEISKREDLENQLDQICKLERSKTSRVSEIRKKRASLDIETLKSKEEVYKHELTSKSQDLMNVNKLVKDQQETIGRLEAQLQEYQNKLEKISDLEKEKNDLDKECEELLSWGRSHENQNKELIEKLAELLKNLALAKLQLSKVAIGKIQFLSNLCKDLVSSLDKVTAEQIEMQLSSKEMSTRNANKRVAEFDSQIEKASCNISLLENLCSDLQKESDAVLNLDDETLSIWRKLASQNRSLKHCNECDLLSKWGKEQEAKAIELGDQVSRLEGRMLTRASRRKGEDESSKAPCSDCANFERVVKNQKKEMADKNAEIVHLKINHQVQNKPLEDTIRRLEEQVVRFKDENVSLKAEMRRALNNHDTTVRETCRRASKTSIATQTTETTSEIYRSQYWSGAPSGIVEGANIALLESRCKKLEQEKEVYKTLCVKRKDRIEYLEKERIKLFQSENQENDEPNKSSYFTRSRKNC